MITYKPSDALNNEASNTSQNLDVDSVIAQRIQRRHWMMGTAATAASGLWAGVGLTACASTNTAGQSTGAVPLQATRLGFKAVPKHITDQVVLPDGYQAQVLYALGDPLTAQTPAFKNDGTDHFFEQRAGDHHDGMEWFGLNEQGQASANSNTHALLAMNHEATTDEKISSFFLHANGGTSTLPRPASEVDKELAIHGLSVVEISAQGQQWAYRQDSGYNRRVTTMTEVALHGPARGSEHLSTRYSPDAVRARGTLNNCGTGKTPWGTLVSGEENWAGYFYRDAKDDERRGPKSLQVLALQRYGRKAGEASRHGWESAGTEDRFQRWNNSALASGAANDYRNEMNTFGYVVELDAYKPQSVVRKRTGLGRFAHESVSFAKPVQGQPLVAFMGDDARGEYIYKFVSKALWDAADAQREDRLAVGDKYLDQGTLYAARFKEDGSGKWLELSMSNPAIRNASNFSFSSAADVAIFTRLAADAAGATKMDRPEWGGINPKNGDLYITLTNNSNRTVEGKMGVDAANPRSYADFKGSKENKGNVHGHIIRLGHVQPVDNTFKWDIYLFASEADADKSRINLSNLTDENDLSAPDGLVFSQATGICWIQTDDGAYTDKSNCMLLAALPGQVGDGQSRQLSYPTAGGGVKQITTQVGQVQTPATLKRFLVGPRDCEITGLCESPDGKALFINIQHPGEGTKMAHIGDPSRYTSQWPANAGYGAGQRPRSATIVITKKDGGVIGS